jgi:hypothetical protein
MGLVGKSGFRVATTADKTTLLNANPPRTFPPATAAATAASSAAGSIAPPSSVSTATMLSVPRPVSAAALVG